MNHNFTTPGYAAAANPNAATIEHWQRVREGRAKPAQHDFGDDTASAIECHRHNARLHFGAATRLMQLVEDLRGAS